MAPQRKPRPKSRPRKSKTRNVSKPSVDKPAAKETQRLEIQLLDASGKAVERIALDAAIADLRTSPHLIYQAEVAARANRRLGTVKTKTRGEVSGGGKKPWRQKGTGRARAGSIRSPLWRKGGTTFGPRPREYGYALPRRMKTLALAAGLKNKATEGRLYMIDAFEVRDGKTKEAAQFFARMPVRKPLLVAAEPDPLTRRAVRNLADARVVGSAEVSPHDVFAARECILTRKGYERLLERLRKDAG